MPGQYAGHRSRHFPVCHKQQQFRGWSIGRIRRAGPIITKVIGVIKAYTTRVGGGPFPTEQKNDIGQQIRDRGNEYGTVPGAAPLRLVRCRGSSLCRAARRRRRVVRYVVRRAQPVAGDQYLHGLRAGRPPHDQFPQSRGRSAPRKADYETLPGWQTEISHMRRTADLPDNARRYLDRLSQLIKVPIEIISVGPDREQTIIVKDE